MTRYRDAGVDLARSDVLKAGLGERVRSTFGSAVRAVPGGFAGFIDFPAGSGMLLAATLDGVGTKLHLALAAGRVSDAAADLVYHCANDLLVHGARPLAFLDYVAQERLDPAVVLDTIDGLARGCRTVGAALLGGETAEMPDTYRPGVVDVAGCMLGVVEQGSLIDGSAVRAGDAVLGLASAGLHTNGFSLARRVLADSGLELHASLPGGDRVTLGQALLAPHRWYGPSLLPLLGRGDVHALAHVTGGGIGGNLVRVLPAGVRARVRARAWPRPAVFRWIVEAGAVPEEDARATLNLGIGMVLVAAVPASDLIAELECSGETVWVIGDVVPGERGVDWVEA